MSIAVCYECGRYVDTDFEPAAYVEIDGEDRCICERCREELAVGEFLEENADQ